MDRLRIDKWLWAARFYKTRSLAADAIATNRVQVNGDLVKASREIRVGDRVAMRRDASVRTVEVVAISAQRGPAPAAQELYTETADSLAAVERGRELRRMGVEPAMSIDRGRPTKRQRRELDGARGGAEWDSRWSASAGPEDS